MTKVPCDPAQVVVNHASFRVQLAPHLIPRPAGSARGGRTGASAAAGGARRRAPVVWSGKSAPDDTGAIRLLQAVRNSGVREVGYGSGQDAGVTQVIPRISVDDRAGPPFPHGPATTLLPRMREAVGGHGDERPRHSIEFDDRSRYGDGSYDQDPYEDGLGDRGRYDDGSGDRDFYEDGPDGAYRMQRPSAEAVRDAYYPGRRMNLGVVLLPLRVFLGSISVYAGMGKLCDPVYFDGGERGSMVKWLHSLHPWALAEPLRDFALSHPVGAGLTIAFLQVIVGVLTVLGLWQRVAAAFGAMLSVALLVTVSWWSVPVYDTPDIIFLAAWSPLVIAGAPVYSVDGRFAGEAWRRLGPRSELWELRRWVLRRGAVAASVVTGLTLLIGSLLGGAVRSAEVVTVPGPNTEPTNRLPGRPLPQEPSSVGRPSQRAYRHPSSPSASTSSAPSTAPKLPGTVRETATVGIGGGRPGRSQGTGPQHSQPQQQAPPPPAASGSGPSSSGGVSGGSTGGSSSAGGDSTGESSTGGANRNPIGGLLG